MRMIYVQGDQRSVVAGGPTLDHPLSYDGSAFVAWNAVSALNYTLRDYYNDKIL